jgi:voltage-gated potassium channel
MHERRSTTARLGQVALVVVAYYLVPVLEPFSDGLAWLRVCGALAIFVLALGWMAREIVRESRSAAAGGFPNRLMLLAIGGLTFFALADLAVARALPGQFTGLETKTDGLYFALTTLVTVGFGDVHADGQVARGCSSYRWRSTSSCSPGAPERCRRRSRDERSARREGPGRITPVG